MLDYWLLVSKYVSGESLTFLFFLKTKNTTKKEIHPATTDGIIISLTEDCFPDLPLILPLNESLGLSLVESIGGISLVAFVVEVSVSVLLVLVLELVLVEL